ncbi:helix-turn-helix domain-containing protein [Amycolatopsis samaneae]|uniref:Helix-turn-helix domain-containing protein n=1 Tax=Amycolatopsis samaneae TaxID=664691 RepID=A0ABW5GKA7_9PSEU
MPYLDPQRLAAARRAAGLSLAELARLVGVGRSRVWDWENGRQSPSPARLTALAEALDADVGQLLAAEETTTLRGMRVRAGLTLAQLAQQAGIPTSTYSGWERTRLRHPPARAVLTALAAALDVEPDDVARALTHETTR